MNPILKLLNWLTVMSIFWGIGNIAYATGYTYSEQQNDKTYFNFYHVEKNKDGYQLTFTSKSGRGSLISNQQGQTLRMNINLSPSQSIYIQRDNNQIKIQKIMEGISTTKSVSIEEEPWIANYFGLSGFVLSDKTQQEYYMPELQAIFIH